MRLAACVMMLGVLAGCGGAAKDKPVLAPVGGVVKLEGQPLANATVTFYPEKGPAGLGMADENGKFRVKTNGSDGATVGSCKVTVSAGADEGVEIPPADGREVELLKKPKLPAKYSNKDTTDLIIEVTPEGNLELSLDLTP